MKQIISIKEETYNEKFNNSKTSSNRLRVFSHKEHKAYNRVTWIEMTLEYF